MSTATDATLRYRSSHERGQALAELCRLQICRVPGGVMTVTALAAASGIPTVVAGWLLIGACCAVGAALNDRADVLSDRANGRMDRPLARGDLDGTDVGVVVAGAAVVAVASQVALPQPTGAAITATAAVLAWAAACEPLALQRRGAVGLVVLGTAYLVLPIGLVLGTQGLVVAWPLALVGAGVLAHKDVRDEPGDRAAGKHTLLVQVGAWPMSVIALALALVGVGGCIATLGPGWWILPAAATVVSLAAMVRLGHRPVLWSCSRVTLLVTAALVGIAAVGA